MRDVVLGFMRVHILHHAAEKPIFGVEMIEELRHHGYTISPGTLYPMLHSLEEAGALRSSQTIVAGKTRRYYRTTKSGDAILAELRLLAREFVNEVLEPPRDSAGSPAAERPARRSA
jgi:PadR family transcriptional regulator, regulatory protein PadR